MKVTIRKAERNDCVQIMQLRKELALHHNMSHLPMLSPKDLERDGFDTQPPLFYCLVAEEEDSEKKRIVGYGLYYLVYAIWEGVSLYLEDLCVSALQRGKGVGKLILKELAQIAIKENYCRIGLDCNNLNYSGMEFYKKNFGVDYTEREGWNLWRMQNDSLHKLAKSSD